MKISFKELAFVMAIAGVVFYLAKPITLRFMAASSYIRRRNVWLILTATAFISPTFWHFTLIAIPLYVWAAREDENPIALYLLVLHVIPPIPVAIPITGINFLFELDNYRLLSFCILIPTAWRLSQNVEVRLSPPWGIERIKGSPLITGVPLADVLLLAFGALQVIQFIPPDLPNHVILQDSVTNVFRRALLFFVDVYALYFAVSRSCLSRRAMVDSMACFCLGCAVMTAIGAFESAKHWLVYVDIGSRWSNEMASWGSYLARSGAIRAQASAGHPLALGYLCSISFGFWLYLQRDITSIVTRFAVAAVWWVGLLAAYSRGPWVGTVTIYFIYSAISSHGWARLARAATLTAVVAGAIAISPMAARIKSVLPMFGGTIDSDSVTYRQRLAVRAWSLITENPFFGDQLAYSKMEDLRQGQGIIDLVNSYVEVALLHGLVALFLFSAFIAVGVLRVFASMRKLIASDLDFGLLGACLVACVLGTLLMMENSSFILGYEKMFYVLGGMCVSYSYLARASEEKLAGAVLTIA